MTKTYDIEELAEEQNMTSYLRQGMLLGHLLSLNVAALPSMDEDHPDTYSRDKLIIKVAHPTKDTTLVYTLVTESVVEE